MQESMEDAIAAESEFHRCNSENHSLVVQQKIRQHKFLLTVDFQV